MSRFHRGGPAFLKPENALKRAEELIAVGQPRSALQTLHVSSDILHRLRLRCVFLIATGRKVMSSKELHSYQGSAILTRTGWAVAIQILTDDVLAPQDIITSKRHRTWHKVLEQIMTRYIDLCVELKKGREAKDGLIHYRNVCQHVNVSSLEEVIKYFLKTATDKAEEAQSKADLVRLTLLSPVIACLSQERHDVMAWSLRNSNCHIYCAFLTSDCLLLLNSFHHPPKLLITLATVAESGLGHRRLGSGCHS